VPAAQRLSWNFLVKVISMLAMALVLALPFAKGPYLQELGPNAVTVRVEVDPPQPVTLEIAGAADGGPKRVESKEPKALHSLRVGALDSAHKYTYTVRAGGASQGGTFTTAPKEDAKGRFTFLVYGDNRSDPVAHASVVRAMQQAPSDFLVNTGDYVEDGREASDWQQFFDAEGPMLRDRCMFGCVGNHELIERAGDNYLRYFGATIDPTKELPRLYGSFRWQNTRFFLLNGQDTFDSGAEIEWLKGALDAAGKEPGLGWRIAVVHFGYRSAGPHGDNPRMLSAGVDRLLREKKVDLVLSGHDHIYERGEEKGMRYVVSGGGGAPLYRVKNPLPSTRKVEPAYHYVAVDVSDVGVKLVAKRVDGSILDACGFGTGPGWDCDAPAPPSTPAPPAPATPASSAPRASSSMCGCAANGAAGGAAPFAALGLLGLLFARRRSRD
jgi:acid phosphatase type 7